MSSTESDSDVAESLDEQPDQTSGADPLFGDYSVLSPGVQIYIDGRAVSAPTE